VNVSDLTVQVSSQIRAQSALATLITAADAGSFDPANLPQMFSQT
jgi:hypothetical protein